MKVQIGLALAFAMALAALPAHAKPLPRYGAFVFSSVCTEQESGDAAGQRLILTLLPDDSSGFFEWSEGPLERVEAEHLNVENGHITFRLHMDLEAPAKFVEATGVITDDAVDLTVGGRPTHMPRQRTLSAHMPDCPPMKALPLDPDTYQPPGQKQ